MRIYDDSLRRYLTRAFYTQVLKRLACVNHTENRLKSHNMAINVVTTGQTGIKADLSYLVCQFFSQLFTGS
jgi:hypothetical protein